jgi:hypothetical protein
MMNFESKCHMKSAFVLLLLLPTVINSYSQPDTTLPVKIELGVLKSDTLNMHRFPWEWLIRRENLTVTTDSVRVKSFDIEISIKNTSKDSIAIVMMSCSWDESFDVNNDYMYIRGWDCSKNIPTAYQFKGGETKKLYATLDKSIKFDYACKSCYYPGPAPTTKLGLIVTKLSYTSKLYIFTLSDFEPLDKSAWRVIWSSPLYLFGK